MLKIFFGFVIFAALAIFVILKGGNRLDMSGEMHGVDAPAEAASAAASDASTAR